jgi:isocitrate lyase
VSDEKQCGHQDGKVTVPHEDFLAKIAPVRYAFLELGVDDGVIVARTDSLGAGLTKQIAVTNEPGDLGDQYNSFLDAKIVAADMSNGDVVISSPRGQAAAAQAPASNLYQFRKAPARTAACSTASRQPAARRRPAVDRDREAAHRPDRRHGEPHPRSRPQCQAGLQQLAVASTGR